MYLEMPFIAHMGSNFVHFGNTIKIVLKSNNIVISEYMLRSRVIIACENGEYGFIS